MLRTASAAMVDERGPTPRFLLHAATRGAIRSRVGFCAVMRKNSGVECTEDETRTTAPASLQPALDALMKRFPQGRCFVRPSGTEDVVRVYAEAETQAQADELALLTAQAAHQHAGGKGPKPTTMVA